ncbi:MAG: hypothetical protein WCA08_17080 [Desulfoferrobacter sp.]
MKRFVLMLVALCFLAAGLAGYPDLVNADNGFNLQGRTSGHCKLSNVNAGKELYNGTCTIKESVSGKTTVYEIKMGSAEPFLFATSDGVTWMHGPEEVKFRDRGHTGIFRWGDFRLEVDED